MQGRSDEPSPGEIVTHRLRLRPPLRSDLDPLHEAISETLSDLVRWLPWAHPGHSRADSRRYLRHSRATRAGRLAYEFALEDRETGNLVGIASIHRVDWLRRSAGLGYWVRQSQWGRGYATEASLALLQYAFGELELNRVEAHIALENAGSHRVAEKLGFHREGIAREVELVNGRYLDHVQYSMLRTDLGGGA
jgi:RimJ/RimL family protein N-acetyltransferase